MQVYFIICLSVYFVSAEAYKYKLSCVMSKTLQQVQMLLLSMLIQYCDSKNAKLDALAKGQRNIAGANYGIIWSREVTSWSYLLEID